MSLLCNDDLLIIDDPDAPDSMAHFQSAWSAAKPVIVAKVHCKLKQEIWQPSVFKKLITSKLSFVLFYRD